MNVLIIFDMHNQNERLFLEISFLFVWVFKVLPSTVILLPKAIQSHKSDLNVRGLNITLLQTEYWPLDKSFTLIHFLVTIIDT